MRLFKDFAPEENEFRERKINECVAVWGSVALINNFPSSSTANSYFGFSKQQQLQQRHSTNLQSFWVLKMTNWLKIVVVLWCCLDREKRLWLCTKEARKLKKSPIKYQQNVSKRSRRSQVALDIILTRK